MVSKKRRAGSIVAVAVVTALLLGGMEIVCAAFSVDVTNFSYSDDSNRSIFYDFSEGQVVDNAIALPETLTDTTQVVTRGTGETGTAYFWGGAPGMPAATLDLDTDGRKATVGPVDEINGGVAALYVDGSGTMPAATGTTSWFYTLELRNFNGDLDGLNAYELEIGLGRDDSVGEPFNAAGLTVVWVKGFYDGVLYPADTLIIQARVQNGDTEIWTSTPIVRTGLDPAATTLMFDLGVDGGNHFYASALIDDGTPDPSMQNLQDAQGNDCTLTTEQGSFHRFPDLFPYLYMEGRSASASPQASVQTFHFESDGKFYASFDVQDPLHQASAVTVTGDGNPYAGSGVDLTWDDTSKRWYSTQSCEIGSTPISSPFPSFIFAFTPQEGGETIDPQVKSITGYVTEFASNLEPYGDVGTVPVFSWTGIAGAAGYGVELDEAGGRLWNIYGIPATQTSVAYDGTALENGTTYSYNILSGIEQDGVWNASLAQGGFTYTGGGTAPATISFNGVLKSVPNWPSTDGMAAISGATVNALNETGTPVASAATVTDGSFAVTGIPASSTFRLVVPPPAATTYVPVLSKFMNWNADIQALLPFGLFTQAQYAAFANSPGTSMILGRVALESDPATFLSDATVTARGWTAPVYPETEPTLGGYYPVTYTGGGSATGSDGVYMVKNVPAGTLVQLTAARAGHTFEFNGAIIPAQTGFLSEESFFATAETAPVITNISATSGVYGTDLTITGNSFGTSRGSVTVGGVPVEVVSWTDTAVVVTVAFPARTGTVVVFAGETASDPSQETFQVTSPYFTVDLLEPSLKVIKGQTAEFLLKSSVFNGFTTEGIGLELQGGDASTLSGNAAFTPVPIKGEGGVVLKIDTADLAAGNYTRRHSGRKRERNRPGRDPGPSGRHGQRHQILRDGGELPHLQDHHGPGAFLPLL